MAQGKQGNTDQKETDQMTAQIIEGTYNQTAEGLYITDEQGREIDSIGPNDMTDNYYEELRAKYGVVFGFYQGGTADGCEAW